ncbi:helix-turn-helix domain-containing protein [Olivibacter sp. LS-1]|uniref:helix-turn-helix domain-containing protein n=1 Tax=Olivibacter sp. LS-1 TaxID=2592345 RepID=UPI00143D2DB2|nr:helix-turn-helix transcriptional regulator [Olivibacter sp. LS-1]
MSTPEELIDVEVCKNIATIQKESGLNQTDFAAKCKVSQKTINHVINMKQNARIDLIKAIVKEFGVSSQWLLFTKGQKYKKDEPKTSILSDLTELKTHVLALEKHRKFTDNLIKKLYAEVRGQQA